MWHEMLRLCGGRNQWQSRQQGQKGRWNGERRDRVSEDRIDVKLSKDSILCLALLEAPDLATEVTELARSSRQFNQARNFAEWILANDIRDRKTLVRTLALDRDARERFYHLFDGIEHIPARESTLAAARELLSPNEEASRQQRLATLLRNLSNLTSEERQELRALSSGTGD
tara:strand:- start:121 stop:636 length:516 start_codon:yes stop_codon:yes gene_type:complete